MSQSDIHHGEFYHWTDLPLHTVLYEWFSKNTGIPTAFSTFFAYIILFLITWYMIRWAVRFLMSIIWPLLLITLAVIVFEILCEKVEVPIYRTPTKRYLHGKLGHNLAGFSF